LVVTVNLLSCKQNNTLTFKIDTSKVENLNDTVTQSLLVLHNYSDKNIIIEDYKVSCSCTALQINKGEKISSNDSLIVPISFARDTIKKNKQVITLTLKTNTKPQLHTVKIIL
jgi:hypothetical protein